MPLALLLNNTLILWYLSQKFHHPIILSLLLILYAIVLSILMSMWSPNFMFSFMLILMMISGLLIIFLYFSSLIANEKPYSKTNPKMNYFLLILNMSWLIMNLAYMLPPYKFPEAQKCFLLPSNPLNNIMKIYHYPFNSLTILTMMYLLLTLFLIIKSCSYTSRTLRKVT